MAEAPVAASPPSPEVAPQAAATPAPAVAPASLPVAPVAAPVVSESAPAPVAPIVSETAPKALEPAEAKSADAPVAPAKSETVLGTALEAKPAEQPKKPAADAAPKPAEGEKKPDGETKAPEGQSAEPAPPPAYETFKLPDGLTADAERLGQFTNLLGELETTTKAEHTAMQAFGQKLVDFHIAEVKATADAIRKAQQTAWDKQKIDWKDEFVKDPEWGGNRMQTTVDQALQFIRTHGGSEAEQAQFRDLMEASGLGNHPLMIKMLARANRAMGEPRPLTAVRPIQLQPKSKVEAMYGRKAS